MFLSNSNRQLWPCKMTHPKLNVSILSFNSSKVRSLSATKLCSTSLTSLLPIPSRISCLLNIQRGSVAIFYGNSIRFNVQYALSSSFEKLLLMVGRWLALSVCPGQTTQTKMVEEYPTMLYYKSPVNDGIWM